jgi:hypothetical protein
LLLPTFLIQNWKKAENKYTYNNELWRREVEQQHGGYEDWVNSVTSSPGVGTVSYEAEFKEWDLFLNSAVANLSYEFWKQ